MNDNVRQYITSNMLYSTFTILQEPTPFCKLFADRDIKYVQVFTSIFCGVFEWSGNKIISLDGDTYNKDVVVYAIDWFTASDGNNGVNILVGGDW
jgi:hypothetical protein